MLRYLRLYGCFLRFSLSRALHFRLDFTFRIVMDAVFYAAHIGFYWILYNKTDLFVNWRFDQIMVFISGYLVLDSLHMTIFANNLWQLPFLINKGDLDYYLLRPVSSLFFLSLREFAANSVMNVVLAGGILAWSLWHYQGDLTLPGLLVYFGLLGVGTLLFFMVHLCYIIPVFWMQSDKSLHMIFFTMEDIMSKPDQIFPLWTRLVLRTLIPFSIMTTIPAELLFNGIQWQMLCGIALVTVWMFLFLRWFWARGLRSYSSASS